MRIIRTLSILMVFTMLLSGCDFFRSILGKPTSKEINQIRIEKEAALAAQKDSLAKVKAQAAQDSINLAAESSKEVNLDARYYVMMGCFKVPSNAVNYKSFLERKGYSVYELSFKSGYQAIAIYASNDYADAYKRLDKEMETGFCPYDIWIYDTSFRLHE